jgi:hypothetical protein
MIMRFGPPVRGYPGQHRKEGTVPNNVALNTLLLLLIFIVELAYVVHVW